ncbi:MAG: AAA family ATPase [Pseudomonadota bacterium]
MLVGKRRIGEAFCLCCQQFDLWCSSAPAGRGKTTFSRMAFPRKQYVSLEDPDSREFAAADPRRFLARYPDGVILDEVQRSPELFSYLQTRANMDGRKGSISSPAASSSAFCPESPRRWRDGSAWSLTNSHTRLN